MATSDPKGLREAVARIVSGAPFPSKRALKKADEIIALLAAQPKEEGCRPTHRHVKRGSEYEVLGTARLQIGTHPDLDYAVLTVYRDQQDQTWARPIKEFNDGRFEPLPAAPLPEGEER